jgi:hypothetical protein
MRFRDAFAILDGSVQNIFCIAGPEHRHMVLMRHFSMTIWRYPGTGKHTKQARTGH